MNQTNWNEAQMRSWRPRQVSPTLKAKIFAPAPDTHQTERTASHWNWLWRGVIPATACALLALAAMNGEPTGSESRIYFIRPIDKLSTALAGVDRRCTGENRLDIVIFDSTNRIGINSNVRFAPITKLISE